VEGPYLSPLEGARGAHAASKMRRPDRSEFDRFQDLACGRIVLLTIAPELENALDLISYVRANHSTRIALGHHLAPREILHRAAEAGATLITHLGNGCPNTVPRHNNVLFHQLAMDSLSAGIVADGNHIPEDFIRVVFRCKGADKVFVVSDAVSIAGFPAGIYETMGNTVRLTETGRIENVNGQHLVGSGCNMAQCMRHLRSLAFLTDEELWQVGLHNPLKILGFSVEPASWAHLPDFSF
jgi:N-acetylglucosamine-6-phosphate deacetylase